MKRRITTAQFRTVRGFLAAGFVLLLGLAVLAVHSEQAARMSNANARQVTQIQAQLTALLFNIQRAETAQRGYLLTDDLIYLAPYKDASSKVPGLLQALSAVLDTSAVRPLVSDKMSELAVTLDLATHGQKDAAMAIVRKNSGLLTMRQTRAWVLAQQAAQAQHLAALEQEGRRDEQEFELAALAGLLATIVLAMGVLRAHGAQTQQVLNLNDELNRIFDLTADILAVMDAEGRLLSLNPAWARLTGHEVAHSTGASLADYVHPDDRPALAALLAPPDAGPQPRQAETRLQCAKGDFAWVAWRAVPVPEEGQIYAIGRDVTDERAREEQLRQSQKMELVGQLTGGIAHDFNNLLTVVLGSLELLKRDTPGGDSKALRRIDAAMDGGQRAAALTHRLLAFARRQPLDPKMVEPDMLVAGMSELLHRVLGEQVALVLLRGTGLWPVLADGHQLENAILNLAVNARDAMPAGGRLTIETQNVTLDAAYALGEAELAPGDYVMVAVSDTGIGMAPEVAAHMFEPFFTTKPVGHGTGLGLAQVYGFIKQSSGHVKIYTELGHGTTVKLYLPRMAIPGTPPEPPAAPEVALNMRGRGEAVLLVEDEDAVRDFAAEVLRDCGYRVTAVENAAAAMPVILSDQHIDLLFTDVVLTGAMDGRRLADTFAQRRPGAKVLFTTGYTRNAIIHHGRLDEGVELLGKPFSAQLLARRVRDLLDAP